MADNRRFSNDDSWKSRVVKERAPNFLNDKDYLEESKLLNATLGAVDTRFLPELDTRLYFTATAKARPDGSIPMVDPEAKALIIYFHGSGTEKASGVNFAGKMNSLAKMGYSTVSFDLPFHRDGSRNPALARAGEFADYLHRLIQKIRQPGLPVYLTGHSFGPDVIAEYLTRYPNSVDGAVMLSPGSFNKETREWFEDKTVYMTKIFGDVEPNNFGGRWASMVTHESTWNKPNFPGRKDPTVVNPKLKVHVVSGDREEYIPGPLDDEGYPNNEPRTYDVKSVFTRFFKNADVKIEPGVGHYIFAHEDADKQDVVLREILRIHGDSLKNEKALKSETAKRWESKTTIDLLAARYSQQPFFRNWLDAEANASAGTNGQSLIAKLVQEGDKKSASKLINAFNMVEKQRIEALDANIRATQQWAPKFYAENREMIEKLGAKGTDPSSIHSKYLAFLKSQPQETQETHSMVSTEVYKLPEKPQPQGPRPPKPQLAARDPASDNDNPRGFWVSIRSSVGEWCGKESSYAGRVLNFWRLCP